MESDQRLDDRVEAREKGDARSAAGNATRCGNNGPEDANASNSISDADAMRFKSSPVRDVFLGLGLDARWAGCAGRMETLGWMLDAFFLLSRARSLQTARGRKTRLRNSDPHQGRAPNAD